MATAFQSLKLSKIFETAIANLSKPFAVFNFPEKMINLSFFGNLLSLFILGYKVRKLV